MSQYDFDSTTGDVASHHEVSVAPGFDNADRCCFYSVNIAVTVHAVYVWKLSLPDRNLFSRVWYPDGAIQAPW